MPAKRRSKNKLVAAELFGDAALDKAFKELPKGMRNQAVRPAVTRMARALQKGAQARAPVDEGRLRRSIKSRIRKNAAGKSLKTKVGRAVYTDTETLGEARFYPAQVELGSAHNEPRSFLRKALAEDGPAIASFGRALVWQKTKELAAKYAAKCKTEIAAGNR